MSKSKAKKKRKIKKKKPKKRLNTVKKLIITKQKKQFEPLKMFQPFVKVYNDYCIGLICGAAHLEANSQFLNQIKISQPLSCVNHYPVQPLLLGNH